jgi:hypothetical protein
MVQRGAGFCSAKSVYKSKSGLADFRIDFGGPAVGHYIA